MLLETFMSHKKITRTDPLSLALPAGGADSHAHLDLEIYDGVRDEVLERARKCGISHIGNVFLDPVDYAQKKHFFADCPEVFFILGIHPADGEKCTPQCMQAVAKALEEDERIRAIGEIGLDFHWDTCPRELQFQTFAMQLKMAKELQKPIVIHCRDAEDACLAFLEAGGYKNYPLLWHCFGGDRVMAGRIIANGWHISVPGTVTYPANTALRDAVAKIPAERLLIETDSPYLSPAAWRGTRDEPAYSVFTAREIASSRREAPEVVWLRAGDNTCRFFGL